MMKIDILSLFPEMFEGFLNTSIIKRAIDKEVVDIKIHNFREFTQDKHKHVDDYPYGGGQGMVLMCQPIIDCSFSGNAVHYSVFYAPIVSLSSSHPDAFL